MKWLWVGIVSVVVSLFIALIFYLSAIGLIPIIPGEYFLPEITDKEQLIRECRELVYEWEEGVRVSPRLAPGDYPPEIARLEPRSVHVGGSEVTIRVSVRGGFIYGFIVHPEEGSITKFRGGTYKGKV